jgi:hypothetical protein
MHLGAGLQAIGISVFDCAAAEMGNEIKRLKEAVEKHQIMTFVLDVPRHDLLLAARGLGIHLLSSPLVGGPLADPAPIRRLSACNIPQSGGPDGVAA